MAVKKRKMARKKTVKKSARQIAVQQALQHTWVLKGQLKTIQMSYLRIGAMLVRVMEEKMFTTLGHPDIEDYAEKRLNLGRSTLYRYISVYEWVKKSHPEWLVKHPQGHIPDLSDIADLMWIEEKLADKTLDKTTRDKLAALRSRGLDGKLRQTDLRAFRKKAKPQYDTLKRYLSTLFTLRRQTLRLKDIPPEVTTKLDGIIMVVQQAIAVKKAGEMLDKAS